MQPSLSHEDFLTILSKRLLKGGALYLYYLPDYWSTVVKMREWTDITILNLGKCQIDDEMVAEHLMGIALPSLESISLENNQLGEQGLECLFGLGVNSWLNLSCIVLDYNWIQFWGAWQLTRNAFPQLQNLSLRNCGLTDHSLAALLLKNPWPGLSKFSIENNNFTLDSLGLYGHNKWRLLKEIEATFYRRRSNQQVCHPIGLVILANLPSQCKPCQGWALLAKNDKIKKVVEEAILKNKYKK